MGTTFSEPIQHDPGLGYVGISLAEPNVVRLMHAPEEVFHRILRVIQDVDASAEYHKEVASKSTYGIIQFKLKASCFVLGTSKFNATYGKLFCIRMFGDMHKLGYDMVASSDLAREVDHATWFFVKKSSERPGARIACVAPGKKDTLVFLFADDQFINTTRAAIVETWQKGIQEEETVVSCGQTLYEIKLHGNPWVDYAGAENVHCRQMLINIIGRLGSIHYKLLVGTNIKGGTDSLFFMYDPNYSMTASNFCMISLNKMDRLRLVNCVEMAGPVRDTLSANSIEPQREEDKYGSWEFKLKGYPWHCSGEEAINSRRLISRISETMLNYGWALTNAIDLSRSINDKSDLLYTKATPFKTNFACIALSDIDKLRLLDFPPNETTVFKGIVGNKYLPGIQSQHQRDSNCWEMKLVGSPWTKNASFSVHAKSALMYIIRAASSMGWRLVSSADVSAKYVSQENGPDYPIDVHSWYFVHLPGTKTEQNPVASGFTMPEPPTKPEGGDGMDPSYAPPSYDDAIQNY